MRIIQVVERTDIKALNLATSDLALIAENTEKLKCYEFVNQSVLKRLVSLETENRKLKEELDDTKTEAWEKYPVIPIVKRPGKTAYIIYAEY